MISDPLLLLLILTLSSARADKVCNAGTNFPCSCTDSPEVDFPPCTDLIESGGSVSAVRVVFGPCAHLLNDRIVAHKIGQWIVQECNSVLECPSFTPSAENIIFLNLNCSTGDSSLEVILLSNASASGPLSTNHLVEPVIVGQVLDARAHLLELLIGSDLRRIELSDVESTAKLQIPDIIANDPQESMKTPALVVACVFGVYIVVVWIIACVKLKCFRNKIGNDYEKALAIHEAPAEVVVEGAAAAPAAKEEEISIYDNV